LLLLCHIRVAGEQIGNKVFEGDDQGPGQHLKTKGKEDRNFGHLHRLSGVSRSERVPHNHTSGHRAGKRDEKGQRRDIQNDLDAKRGRRRRRRRRKASRKTPSEKPTRDDRLIVPLALLYP